MVQLQNQNATVYYAYDGRNRTTNETYLVNPTSRQVVDLGCSGSGGTSTTSGGLSKAYKILYGYSSEVQSSITYSTTSRTVNYAYDSLGRVSNASSAGTFYGKFSYYQNDQVKSIIYGNGLTANYTYDKMERPLNLTLFNGNSKLMSLVYAYNRTGTVLSVKGQVNTVTDTEIYKYDSISRLTNATFKLGATNTTLWYSYDAAGNRLGQSINGTLTSYVYNSVNELTSSSATGTSTTYRYDPDGNLANPTTTGSGTITYTWNSSGQLLKVSNGTPQGRYAYDGQGRRLESVESSTIFYSYSGTETLSETPSSSTETDYIRIGGMVVAKATGSTVYYYQPDGLGSTRLVTDASKTVKFADNYKPFGEDNGTPYCSGTCENYKFTGKPVSQTTGLYYEYQRWYDPTIGRFISPDPRHGHLSNPQSLNLYIYVLDLPTSLTDPSGLDWNNVRLRPEELLGGRRYLAPESIDMNCYHGFSESRPIELHIEVFPQLMVQHPQNVAQLFV